MDQLFRVPDILMFSIRLRMGIIKIYRLQGGWGKSLFVSLLLG